MIGNMVLKCVNNDCDHWMHNTGDENFHCDKCGKYFDKKHADHMAEELKKDHFLHGSNWVWFWDVFRYFHQEKILPEVKMIEHGIGQWMYIDEIGRKEVLEAFRSRKFHLQHELILIDDVIKELEA